MFNQKETSSSVSQQIINRESNYNRNPKAFAANLFRARLRVAKNLYRTDLRGHFGCVNAIEFSHGGEFLASGGDDKRVLVWDVEKSLVGKSTPRALATEQASNIFCLGFDSKNRKLISGGNDTLAISHDFETGKLDNVFKHDGPVYGLSIDPQNENVFATASENGEISLFDQRSTIPTVIASMSSSFHAVEFHPTTANLLITANSKRGAILYDIRKPKQPLIQYSNKENSRSCMSVRFNRSGKLILGLRRRLPPILYHVNSPEPICTFYHPNYYNSCTMKSCTFAGEDDELVISGSDDFNLYVWRLSDIDMDATETTHKSTQMVLYGHRSIVNQVRYNRQKCLLASSGVEKIVKIWSPFSQHNWTGSLTEEASCSDNPRELYSPYNVFTMTLPDNWHHLSHDYSSENTNEDPRMMAFFDSLIQQEIEDWETNSSTEASQEDDRSISSFFSCGSTSSTSGSSSSSNSSNSSTSSSSSSSDSENEHNNEMRRKKKRSKRKTTKNLRRKRRRTEKLRLARAKLNKQKRRTKRITDLVITKQRNSFRRSLMSPGYIDMEAINTSVTVSEHNQERPQSPTQRNSARKSRTTNSGNNERPTTSAAATAGVSDSLDLQCNTQNEKIKSDLSDSSEEDSGNFAVSSSSRSNAVNSSSSSNNNNTENVASTSTGITSNFRDAFLRLSRQIFVSDSDDDDDDYLNEYNTNKQNNTSSRNTESNEKKHNGINKRERGRLAEERRSNSTKSSRPNYRPRNSAALNVINTNETILPQRNHPTNDKTSSNKASHVDDTNCNGSRSSSKNNKKSSAPHRKPKKRLYTITEIVEDLPSTSSRATNVVLHYDLFPEDSSTSSNSLLSSKGNSLKTSRNSVQNESPLKKRKISTQNSEVDNEGELNNNETNNNNIFSTDESTNNIGQFTPERPALGNVTNDLDSFDTVASAQQNNMNSYMFTPDSGVSLNNSTTPSTIDHNNMQASTSNSARIGTHLSTVNEENDCDVNNVNENDDNDDDDDEGVVVVNRNKLNTKEFRNKVASIRRNYRRHFSLNSDSD